MKLAIAVSSFCFIFLLGYEAVSGYGFEGDSSDRVLLKDVHVITLTHGHFTNGRRSAGVPQLKCTGGSAGCHTWTPSTVQCYNKGSDGYDYQWECKSDMPNQFKFGALSVSCEGYSSPNDPYVLRGSCGLEYNLELTSTHQSTYQHGHGHPHYAEQKSSTGNMLLVIALLVIAVAIYYTCISPASNSGTSHGTQVPPPPPPGFRSSFFPNSGSDHGYDGCNRSSYSRSTAGTGTGGGGFWTGAATGGLLGYMFGQNSGRSSNTYSNPSYGFQDTFGSSSGYRTSSSQSPPPSSSTHTSSGFGGTKRR